MMKASIRIDTDCQADRIAAVLSPETDDDISRASMRASGRGRELVLDIQADDLVALRAAVNSYLRWTKLAIDASMAAGAIG